LAGIEVLRDPSFHLGGLLWVDLNPDSQSGSAQRVKHFFNSEPLDLSRTEYFSAQTIRKSGQDVEIKVPHAELPDAVAQSLNQFSIAGDQLAQWSALRRYRWPKAQAHIREAYHLGGGFFRGLPATGIDQRLEWLAAQHRMGSGADVGGLVDNEHARAF